MFPKKIRLTDDLIELIIETRKHNALTAYQLSEAIGKNKSWLPNIENHRTKNISNEDLLLIFSDFAKKEGLSPELYIIKHLNPAAQVQLDNGDIVPCRIIQKKYELLSDKVSVEELLDDFHFEKVDRPYIESIEQLHNATKKLGDDLEKEFVYIDDVKIRNSIFDSLENIKATIKANYQLANLFFNIDIVPQNQKISSPEELLEICDIKTFPVNLDLILKYLNLKVVEKTLIDELSGSLDVVNKTIYLEKSHSQTRKNFTIAHELGHYCLHQEVADKFEDKIFFRSSVTDEHEHQANNFAGELLMPKDEFLLKIKSGINTIQELATYFNVSTLAIRVRAKQLNLTGHGL